MSDQKLNLEELLASLNEQNPAKAPVKHSDPLQAEIVKHEAVPNVVRQAEGVAPVADDIKVEELNRHTRITEILEANYYTDRKEIQAVVDQCMKLVEAAAPVVGGVAVEFPRGAVETLAHLLDIKSRSGDIMVRLLDSRSKLLSALKAASGQNAQTNVIIGDDAARVKKLLAEPMRDDEVL